MSQGETVLIRFVVYSEWDNVGLISIITLVDAAYTLGRKTFMKREQVSKASGAGNSHRWQSVSKTRAEDCLNVSLAATTLHPDAKVEE